MENELIKKAYNIFSKYHLGDKVTACYCNVCMTEEFSDYLKKTLLKEISADSMNSYISCVGIEENDYNDFKYFFPRILDLLNEDRLSPIFSDFYIFIWGTLERLDYSGWEYEEQKIFIEFFDDYWRNTKNVTDPELTDLSIASIKAIVLKPQAL